LLSDEASKVKPVLTAVLYKPHTSEELDASFCYSSLQSSWLTRVEDSNFLFYTPFEEYDRSANNNKEHLIVS